MEDLMNNNYNNFLEEILSEIHTARISALLDIITPFKQ